MNSSASYPAANPATNGNQLAASTAHPLTGSVAANPGVGSTVVIVSCTALLVLASTAALWTKVEPVILLVARYTG